MENVLAILKAVADGTRLRILQLLLRHNYCVGALAHHLQVSESAISQHLKVLRNAGLVSGEKRGYFMHYRVNRRQLRMLAAQIEQWATLQSEPYRPAGGECPHKGRKDC